MKISTARAASAIAVALLCGVCTPPLAILRAEDDPPPDADHVRWLHLGAEVRLRGEAGSGIQFDPQHSHLDVLSRLRLSAEIRARSWLRLRFEAQDARALAGEDSDIHDAQTNAFDVRDGYLELGKQEGGSWNLEVGRQPLELGEGRLVGADDYWCNRSRRFDGVRAKFAAYGWRWDAFSGTEVSVDPDHADQFYSGDRLSGVYGRWGRPGTRLAIEPYFLWTNRLTPLYPGADPSVFAGRTPGVRLLYDLPANSSFTTEMAWQFGNTGTRPIQAWAGSWTFSHRIGVAPSRPAMAIGYAWASGDRGAGTGARGTFNDLYPAGFNSCGWVSPFAWRNIRDLSWSTDWKPARAWHLAAELHGYWLATTKDGVYVDEDSWFRINPQASTSRLGMQWNSVVEYKRSSHWALGLGYAHFFAGPYFRSTSPAASSDRVFLAGTITM